MKILKITMVLGIGTVLLIAVSYPLITIMLLVGTLLQVMMYLLHKLYSLTETIGQRLEAIACNVVMMFTARLQATGYNKLTEPDNLLDKLFRIFRKNTKV